MGKGLFIAFEGSDGSGKTTQIKLLAEYFKKRGIDCVVTREPGGTKIGEIMRNILKDVSLNSHLSIQTEVLLLQVSRAQHVHELIKPAVQSGKIVLCDRYADSSVAYQGGGYNLGCDVIENLNSFSTSGFMPDLTILLDIEPKAGLLRADKRENGAVKDRWEAKDFEFHKKVRETYLYLAKKYPERFRVISASEPIDKIHNKIVEILKNEFKIG